MTDEAQTVLVLGGGVGGVVAAVELKKRIGDNVRTILVDRDERHLFWPSVLRVMTGDQGPEESTASLERLEEQFGVEFVEAEIESIEPEAPAVQLGDDERLEADKMVVALGAELAPEEVHGLSEAGHNLYSVEGAERFREELDDFESGDLAVLTPPGPYVCPPAPYGASMLLDAELRERGVRDDVQLDHYAAQPAPVGIAGPVCSSALRGWIDEKGIDYHPEHEIERVDASGTTLHFADGDRAGFDLLAYVPPHRAPEPVREAEMTGESGWIPVDRETLRTEYDDVFAVGDVTHIPLATGKPLPMAGVFAKGQAEVVAEHIIADIGGRDPVETFGGQGKCFLDTGDGEASTIEGDFYAEPEPDLELTEPSRERLWDRYAFEKKWFFDWFRKPF